MARFRPSELQEYLRSIGAKPEKGMSQNFLIDGNILDKIIALADVQSDDVVVEIGPGPGALTERLLETGCQVVAIEKDPIFAKALASLDNPRLTVHTADVLEFDLNGFSNAKVVANLPYNITTPILQKILPMQEVFTSVTVMVQEEVARRLCFDCAVKDFVAFTLFLQYYSKPQYGFTVSPQCFFPAPRVHSSVIRLNLEKRFQAEDEAFFFDLINTAFSQRRKMIKATLKAKVDVHKIEEALLKIGKPITARPEELTLEEWVSLAVECGK
ncbi:MAG: 16S rRNA (adenine(1518)-N(6)/adenine(1519)-N(6))-dimethyltransferase RsmA [Chlamydiales bacterium]|nr:16S rRNA (adenine(1518)-N(6)/adenine(1519)-N(6))-dimethyltransferase RsmA [Chlamydiales bacterium]